MFRNFVYNVFPGLPYKQVFYLVGGDGKNGKIESGDLTIIYDIVDDYFKPGEVKILWDGKPVYCAKHYNTVTRFNRGEEWLADLEQLCNDKRSKEKRKHAALFRNID